MCGCSSNMLMEPVGGVDVASASGSGLASILGRARKGVVVRHVRFLPRPASMQMRAGAGKQWAA